MRRWSPSANVDVCARRRALHEVRPGRRLAAKPEGPRSRGARKGGLHGRFRAGPRARGRFRSNRAMGPVADQAFGPGEYVPAGPGPERFWNASRIAWDILRALGDSSTPPERNGSMRFRLALMVLYSAGFAAGVVGCADAGSSGTHLAGAVPA